MRAVVFAAIAAVAWLGSAGEVRRAEAASPRAELVVTWAPGRADAAAEAAKVAKRFGAAAVDVTPAQTMTPSDRASLVAGRAAYEALRFDEALASLDAAARALEKSGGEGLTTAELADLFLFRALTLVQLGRAGPAWEDFVRAATMDLARALDPAELPPRAIEQFERARAHVAASPRAQVRLVGASACQIVVDGRSVGAGERAMVQGRHWLAASCPGAAPVQRGFDVVDAAPVEVAAMGAPLPSSADDAALVQARAMEARAFVIVTVNGELALLRRVGIDGREQARRAVRIAAGAPVTALGEELLILLAPVEERGARTPWYRSRWAWAAAGVVAATAVLLPFALRDDGPDGVVIRPSGAPW